ncbi:MAG: isoamylase early set domain-containing protein [Chloroflexota bacterium]
MIKKQFGSIKNDAVKVTFSLPQASWIDQVHLVGDFNNWNEQSHPFGRDQKGTWTLTLKLQPNQSYQFRYLCDGRWTSEFRADGHVTGPDGVDSFVVYTNAGAAMSIG